VHHSFEVSRPFHFQYSVDVPGISFMHARGVGLELDHRTCYDHRQAPLFFGVGSRVIVSSSVANSSLRPGDTTQPRLTREGTGLEHSPSVRTSMPSHLPRFFGSLTILVGALKSVPPPRTLLASTLLPFFHSKESRRSAAQSKGRMVTETFFVREESSEKNRANWPSSTEPDWSMAMRSLAT